MQQCTRCLIESSDSKADIDTSGICSYCRAVEQHAEIIAKIGNSAELLRDRLSQIKGEGDYDCLAGFSGGKDSSFVIHSLKTRYGARVLAFTLDNGFLTDYARDNMNRLAREFGFDHLWIHPDKEVLRALYAKSLSADCWPCSACFHLVEASTWKIAFEKKIPFIVHGRIPEQILRQPHAGSFAFPDSLIGDNFAPYDFERARQLAAGWLKRLRTIKRWLLPDRALWPSAEKNIYLPEDYSVPENFAPELLGFFLYEPYDEANIMDFLEKETTWVRPEKTSLLSHADCLAHHAAGYLYYHRHKRQFLSYETSAMIRHGKLTREQGEELLKESLREALPYPKESIKILSEASGLSPLALRTLPSRIRTRENVKGRVKKALGRA